MRMVDEAVGEEGVQQRLERGGRRVRVEAQPRELAAQGVVGERRQLEEAQGRRELEGVNPLASMVARSTPLPLT